MILGRQTGWDDFDTSLMNVAVVNCNGDGAVVADDDVVTAAAGHDDDDCWDVGAGLKDGVGFDDDGYPVVARRNNAPSPFGYRIQTILFKRSNRIKC